MADITANGLPPAAHRPGEHPDLPPPLLVAGPIAWLKRNFFSSIGNTILTILAVVLLYLTLPGLFNWAVTGEFRRRAGGHARLRAQGHGKHGWY
jgi:hypothetical protein